MHNDNSSAISPEEQAFVVMLRQQADEDADAVANFLRERGIFPGESLPVIRLPKELLEGLALALRFQRWEQQHIHIHLAAGFPAGRQLLQRVISADGKDPALSLEIRSLGLRRIQLLRDSFLWSAAVHGPPTDLALVASDDESFLDAVADFLIQQLQIRS